MGNAASKSSLRGGWAILAAAATLLAAACITGPVRIGPPTRSGPVRVTGTLVAIAPPDLRSPRIGEIELADVRVYLADARGNRAAETVTRLDGRFDLSAPAAGPYRLCYEIGTARGCAAQVRGIGATVALGQVVAAVHGVHGRVLTGDGRPCWISDSFFGLDVSTQVSARRTGAAGPPAASTRANSEGEYLLSGLPDGNYDVSASCEAARAASNVRVTAGLGRADFGLPNRAPVIRTAAAYAGAAGRTSAVAGETLALRADVVDPEGDTIQYIWRGLPQAGPIAGGGANVQWQLPATPGLISAYLIARDGRGGYAYRRIDMEVGANRRIALSGVVLDETTGRAIAGAVVTLGQESARTGVTGAFSLEAEPRDDGRYVVNIRHPDYALMSRVLGGNARGASYGMTAAQISRVEAGPTAAGAMMRVVDRASAGFCGAAGDGRERPLVRRATLRADGEARRREEEQDVSDGDEPCLRRGAEIDIPAGALVDDRGAAVSGDVRAAITTLNPARRALPGDYSAINRSGETVSLLSYGAVDARFTDGAGRPLNLRPGTSAEVRIPVPPSQAGSAPPTMAMWSYDEARGRWIEEGQAVLQRGAEGAVYVGRTRHFSTINIDLPGWTLANVTCLRVELDPGFGSWTNKVLRAYVSYGGTAVQVREVQLDNSLVHAVYTIPWGTTLPHNTVRLELRGTDTSNNIVYVLLNRIVDTDALSQMNPVNGAFPGFPYNECPSVTLGPPASAIPNYGDIDATGRPSFLTGPAGSPTFNPPIPDTAAYYTRLDQTGSNPGARATLGAWWGANGFNPANGAPIGGTNSANAAYTNYNDLGFGRDMHCLERNGGLLACYVTNYGLPDQSGANADAAAAHTASLQGGTVTMEYEPSLGVNAVRFYVYGGGVAGSQRINYADLDGLGPKPVPYLCTVCHGGRYVPGDHDVENARFREFDLPSFLYPANRVFNQNFTHNLQPAEIAEFGKLNQMVRNAQPLILGQPTPVRSLIDNWYSGTSGFAGAPALPAVPPNWDSTNPALQATYRAAYHDVYGRSCRTCHIARDEGYPNAPLVFDSYASFTTGFVKSRVCGFGSPKRRVMPNAYVTYRNFWADPTLPQAFEALYGTTNTCGN